MRHPAFRSQLEGQVAPRLSGAEIRAIDAATSDPRFHLFAGEEDGKLRRITASLRLRDPRAPRDPRRQGVMRLRLDLRGVDAEHRIVAPKQGEPIRRLLRRLGVSGKQVPGTSSA